MIVFPSSVQIRNSFRPLEAKFTQLTSSSTFSLYKGYEEVCNILLNAGS